MKADLHVANHGSIFLLKATSKAGKAWIDDNIPDDAMWFGGAVVVEHRYISDIVNGAQSDGLTVK